MSTWTRYSVGNVSPGEGSVEVYPKYPKAAGTQVGVMHVHGAGGNGVQAITPEGKTEGMTRLIAAAGQPTLASDWGGPDTWGNATAVARIGTGRSFLQASMGAKSGKVSFTNGSMGAATTLNWAGANPTLVASIVMIIPVINVTDIHTNNRGGYAGAINAAYGGAYSEATYGALYNPFTQAQAGKYAGIPMLCFYGTSDALCLPTWVTQMAALPGMNMTLVPMDDGHTFTAYEKVNQQLAADFTASYNV